MKAFARIAAVGSLLWLSRSEARPWNGVLPGVTKRAEVVKKFGEPSKTLEVLGREVLAYVDDKAIRGTQQALFRVDPATGVIARIDVFPEPIVDRDTVESTFGRECRDPTLSASCYVQRLTEDFRPYWDYSKLGLAVFFKANGKTVESFIFLAPDSEGVSTAKRSK